MINLSLMVSQRKKMVVKKVTPETEQRMKDEAFLKLTPAERLKIHEQLRKRIWGEQYNKLSLKGLKIKRKKGFD